MLGSTIRTIVTSRASIGLASVALLGAGAALAAPDGTPAQGVLAAVSTPLEVVPPTVPAEPEITVAGQPELAEDLTDGTEASVEEPLEPLEEPEQADEPPVAEVEDDDGPGWALGRRHEPDAQQQRVEDFCDARAEEAAEDAENEGLPPFCTSNDGEPEPPNAFRQRTAAAARGGELADDDVEGVGPPPWVERRDGQSDDGVEAESAGPPEGVRTGPPAGVPGRGPGSGD